MGTHDAPFQSATKFKLVAERVYTPEPALPEEMAEFHKALRLQRVVIVTPSIYGTDNRAMIDALSRYPERFRGVAVVDPGIDDRELAALHKAGVRGVRANLLNRGGILFADACALAGRFADLGWHLQLQIDVSTFDRFDAIAELPVDVVIDHMGYMSADKGPSNPGFLRLLKLVEAGRCWVKLSAPYRLTDWQRFGYEEVAPLARALARANPQRTLWGSDWPHTDLRSGMPNDGDLLDLLGAWIDDDATREAILVTNPASLYGA